MRILFSGPESKKKDVPFLVDEMMRPATEVNAWLRALSRDGATSSKHTLRTYAYHLFDFLSFLESRGASWEQATDDLLLEYRDVQDQNPSKHTKTYLSRRTINFRLLAVGWFYKFACGERLISDNPIKYKKVKVLRPADRDPLAHIGRAQISEVPTVSFERLGRRDIKWRPHDEIMRWLNSIDDWADKLTAKILYRLGLRREELTNLELLRLPDRFSVNPMLPEISFSVRGKGGKERLVYMSARDFNELHDYVEIVRAARMRKPGVRHDFIFVDKGGLPLKPAQVNRLFARVSRRCGIHVTPHMMRHSFAVMAMQHWKAIGLSRPDKLLQGRLGHANVTTTQIYMHMTDEMKAQEAYANATLIELLMRGEANGGES